jgi:FlaG/FlaF family flagellin (archaellin)
VTGNTTLNGTTTANGTVQVGSTGTPLNEIRTGTCSNPNTQLGESDSADVTCTIAGNPDLRNFTISLTPNSAPPRYLSYSVGLTTSTAIVIHWVNIQPGALVNTGAITFKWVAVR